MLVGDHIIVRTISLGTGDSKWNKIWAHHWSMSQCCRKEFLKTYSTGDLTTLSPVVLEHKSGSYCSIPVHSIEVAWQGKFCLRIIGVLIQSTHITEQNQSRKLKRFLHWHSYCLPTNNNHLHNFIIPITCSLKKSPSTWISTGKWNWEQLLNGLINCHFIVGSDIEIG